MIKSESPWPPSVLDPFVASKEEFMFKRLLLSLVLVALWPLNCCWAVAQDAVPVGTAKKILVHARAR